jgi:adenylate cyclase
MATSLSLSSLLSRLRLPLLVKLSVIITVTICLTAGAIGFIVLKRQGGLLRQELTARGQTLIQHLSVNVSTPLLERDELALHMLVEEIARNKDVSYVAVVDRKGVVLAHSDLRLIGKALPASDPKQSATSLDLTIPIRFQQVELGQVRLGMSEEGIRQNFRQARLFIVVLVLGIIVLGLGASVYASNVFAKPIRLLVAGAKAVGRRDFDLRLPTLGAGPGADELTDLGAAFNEMAEGLRQKELLQDSFGRYVSPEIAEMIFQSADGPWLLPARREVTVLFVDVRGFTPYAERMTPDAIIDMLNRFFGLATASIMRSGGFINKFLGDALMAVFGAPAPQAEHSYNAAVAALEIQQAVQKLNVSLRQEGNEPIEVGIGINRGEVVAGSVGSQERMEYTVVGDAVNVASRLTAAAKAGEILISQSAYISVADRLQVESISPVRLKGKTELLQVFLLIGKQDDLPSVGPRVV